jgi:hypothetical protein
MAGFVVIETGLGDLAWSSANWVYYGLLEKTIENAADTPEITKTLTMSMSMQSLSLKLSADKDTGQCRTIHSLLLKTCDQIGAGEFLVSVNNNILDHSSQLQFRGAVRHLSKLLTDTSQLYS